jgi:hypothetical protein
MKMDAVKWHPGPFAASVTGFDENSDRHRRPFFYHHYHIIKHRFCQMAVSKMMIAPLVAGLKTRAPAYGESSARHGLGLKQFPPRMPHGTAAALHFYHMLDKSGNRGIM